jgi:hypothetical protein
MDQAAEPTTKSPDRVKQLVMKKMEEEMILMLKEKKIGSETSS